MRTIVALFIAIIASCSHELSILDPIVDAGVVEYTVEVSGSAGAPVFEEGSFTPQIALLDNDDPIQMISSLGFYSRVGSLVRASYVIQWNNMDPSIESDPVDVTLPFEYHVPDGEGPALSGEIVDFYSEPPTNGEYVPVITYYDSTKHVRIRQLKSGRLALPSEGFEIGIDQVRRLRFEISYRTNGRKL